MLLSGTTSTVFTNAARIAADDRYLDDLAALYELAGSTGSATAISRTYGEMAARVLNGYRDAPEPIDLIILTYANSEILPSREAGLALADAFPSVRMVYAISDQGMLAPFTALKLIAGHFRERDFERAAIVVLEQSYIPLICDQQAKMPTGDVAVAVIVERGASVAPDVTSHVILRKTSGHTNAARALQEVLRAEISHLTGDPVIAIGESVPLIHEFSTRAPYVHRALPGRVCTGVWERIDQCVRGTPGYSGPVLAVEYDRVLDYLAVASLQVRLPDV
jgi:hypothetical protein